MPDNIDLKSPENTQARADGDFLKFPYVSEVGRLTDYGYNKNLFLGKHFKAFNIRIDDPIYANKEYYMMRYLSANFPGLISKIMADLLFIEPPKIRADDGDQNFIDALQSDNKMRVQNYESALMNSYFGDGLYKLRVGKRRQSDKETSVIIEQVTPRIYFPVYDPANVTGEPLEQELAWVVTIAGRPYLRKEIHKPGLIKNQLWELEGTPQIGYKIKHEADIGLLNIPGLLPEVVTGIDRSLLIHIPNWRPGERHFGLSDYYDLDTLFYAINNRLTKVDNILDKHGDPILAVPPGIIGEDGKIKKKQLGVIELAEGEEGKPEYIVWDAKLDSAFSQMDRLIETVFMISETSPVVAGLDKGGNLESGRALKYKMLRTIAKAQRKQLYYTEGLKEVFYVAQLLAKEYNVKIDGVGLTQKPVKPEIVWSDGLPADMTELIDNEIKRIDAGLTSTPDAIARIDDVDEDTAEKKAKEIKAEKQIDLKSMQGVAKNGFGGGVDSDRPASKPNGFATKN